LGEILFWIGNWTAAMAAYHSGLNWVAASIGLLGIVFVMMVSTIQLEQKQNKRYGNLQAYQWYTNHVPILIPIVPLYSLESIGKKWRWRL
jgi:steroid 5-alpha reductase family enzyme